MASVLPPVLRGDNGGPTWLAFILQAVLVAGAGVYFWAGVAKQVDNNSATISRIEEKTDAAFKQLNADRAASRSGYDAQIASLWSSVHGHDLSIQSLQNSISIVKDLKDDMANAENRREERFQQSARENNAQMVQLHDISGQLSVAVDVLQQVVVCLNQEGGCKHLGMPLPYTGKPAR